MKFYVFDHSGTVVHAALSHRAAVDGTDPCEHCGRGGRRALPARVRLWCQRGPVRRDRLAEHDGPATCKMCLHWGGPARDARERGGDQ